MFQAVDLNKPVDKKLYKGTNPTCHNFNQTTATADSAPLLVGFSTGQIQLIDPIKKELSKLYNEDVRISKFCTDHIFIRHLIFEENFSPVLHLLVRERSDFLHYICNLAYIEINNLIVQTIFFMQLVYIIILS